MSRVIFDRARRWRYLHSAMKYLARRTLALVCGCVGALTASCSTPMGGPSDLGLRRSILESTTRELAQAERSPALHEPVTIADSLDFSEDRLDTLRKLSGVSAYGSITLPMGDNLLGKPTTTVAITLDQAIARSVDHNLEAQLARVDAAASRQDIVVAEALFDMVFFADASNQYTDQPARVRVIGGVPIGTPVNRNNLAIFDTGIRKNLASGGDIQITQTLSIFNSKSPGTVVFPDPARTVTLNATLNQPLLRGFGSDVALSEIRLASNLSQTNLEELRGQLIAAVASTQRAYWALVLSHRTVQINQRLLERGVQTRDVLKNRLQFDVKPAEYSDAVARVQSRRADVIRAVNDLRLRSDELKALMNDPDLTVGGEDVILPIDSPTSATLRVSLFDSLSIAFAKRPEIRQAILAIDDAAIRERVADNARLPLLDLQLAASLSGLGTSASSAFDQLGETDFVDYLIGLKFEQPIGNRAAKASYRKARLDRLRSVVAYRSTAQQVVTDVKTAMRNLFTNHQLIRQTRIARLAAAENLRTLLNEEKNIRGLTPDFLDLKLRRQDSLAIAEKEEIQALVDYNVAIADLYAALGDTLTRSRIRLQFSDMMDPSVESLGLTTNVADQP
jgi:outer membrane protein